MEHDVGPGDCFIERIGPKIQVPDAIVRVTRGRGAVALLDFGRIVWNERIDANNLVPEAQQLFDKGRADEPGGASHDPAHAYGLVVSLSRKCVIMPVASAGSRMRPMHSTMTNSLKRAGA